MKITMVNSGLKRVNHLYSAFSILRELDPGIVTLQNISTNENYVFRKDLFD